jgi:hypothetical protein
VAETIDSDLDEVTDDDLVAQLTVKAARLAEPRPVTDDAPTTSGDDFDLDDAIDAANAESADYRR